MSAAVAAAAAAAAAAVAKARSGARAMPHPQPVQLHAHRLAALPSPAWGRSLCPQALARGGAQGVAQCSGCSQLLAVVSTSSPAAASGSMRCPAPQLGPVASAGVFTEIFAQEQGNVRKPQSRKRETKPHPSLISTAGGELAPPPPPHALLLLPLPQKRRILMGQSGNLACQYAMP